MLAQLPFDLLFTITEYLSMRDVINLSRSDFSFHRTFSRERINQYYHTPINTLASNIIEQTMSSKNYHTYHFAISKTHWMILYYTPGSDGGPFTINERLKDNSIITKYTEQKEIFEREFDGIYYEDLCSILKHYLREMPRYKLVNFTGR